MFLSLKDPFFVDRQLALLHLLFAFNIAFGLKQHVFCFQLCFLNEVLSLPLGTLTSVADVFLRLTALGGQFLTLDHCIDGNADDRSQNGNRKVCDNVGKNGRHPPSSPVVHHDRLEQRLETIDCVDSAMNERVQRADERYATKWRLTT